jgi:hypothetical protein
LFQLSQPDNLTKKLWAEQYKFVAWEAIAH